MRRKTALVCYTSAPLAGTSSTNPVVPHPYAPFLARMSKPTRYTGAEYGVHHKPWDTVEARFCLAFPDVYDIGMSHLGFRILYRLLNDDPRLLAERCYTPWVDLQNELRKRQLPLVSLESARPLADFDVVGFSLQYELTYTNLLTMLELGGIPLRQMDRTEEHPLVVAGGPVATHAEPIAPFLDALVIGDGEELASELALQWTQDRAAGHSRGERLRRLARLGGVYVPSLYATARDATTGLEVVTRPAKPDLPFPIQRRLVADLDKYPFPDDGPVGGPEAVFDRMSIEVARGCTEGCRFCQAGMIYRPVRERDPREVVETVVRAIEKSGHDEVSLAALSTADVSCISPLIKSLVEKTAPRRVSLSVASLRAYGLEEDLIDDMRQVRAAGLTFAPEAGTQRMRDVINKNVTEAQLLETAERVFARGHDRMKLYFMIGLPTETEPDVLAIIEVGANALAIGRRVSGRAKVTVSVSTHVPKPHTPFQWCAMDTLEEVQHKQGRLREAVRAHRGLALRVHDATTSLLEGVLARGDRRLADVIEHAYRHGARFDGWEDHLEHETWQRAFQACGVDPADYLGTLPVDGRLPWDHVDVGLAPGFLAAEYRKALKNRLSPPCSKAVGQFVHHTNVETAEQDRRRLVCYHCGVACDLTQMRRERIDVLRGMNALKPGVRTRLPVAPPAPQQRRIPPYRPPQPGGPAVRWRLRYSKVGPISLLGHLDLVRELGRVLRRAGLQVRYTEGFHPKPDMTFGPALSLGASSLGEYLDVKLIAPPPVEDILARLNAAAPKGLGFVAAAALTVEDRSLSRVVDCAEYVVALDPDATRRLDPPLPRRLAAFCSEESIVLPRIVKGRPQPVDVRASVHSVELDPPEADQVLLAADLSPQSHTLRLRLRVAQQRTARPCEVVAALTGQESFPHTVVRVGLTLGDLGPLDLSELRAVALAAARNAPERGSQDSALPTPGSGKTDI